MRRVLLPVLLGVALVGCEKRDSDMAVKKVIEQEPTSREDYGRPFRQMSDAALRSDMTLTDIHFEPHRTMLSELGRERLNRLAHLMKMYGGTIRYSSYETDEALNEGRMSIVVDYLAYAGIDTSREPVREDLAGGRGLGAPEVILVKTNEGTYKARKSASSSGAGTSVDTNK
ncbi:MAG: hypothetical protein KDA32_12310 [Phycisphaerales bacterium]|nr:hypothetical protein [Phycisphaerales bacterium]